MNYTTRAQRINARQDKIWEEAKAAKQRAFAELFHRAAIRVGGSDRFSDVAFSLLQSPSDTGATVSLIDAQNLIRAALRELDERQAA